MMHGTFGRFCEGLFRFGRFHSGGFIMMGLGLLLVLAVIYFIFKKTTVSNPMGAESPLDLLQKGFFSYTFINFLTVGTGRIVIEIMGFINLYNKNEAPAKKKDLPDTTISGRP